ncbi:MAG TPA: hypothetical protein VKR58_01725, partial [Aquella sp.]|nr:hypothetical protein [Aquella sp.]
DCLNDNESADSFNTNLNYNQQRSSESPSSKKMRSRRSRGSVSSDSNGKIKVNTAKQIDRSDPTPVKPKSVSYSSLSNSQRLGINTGINLSTVKTSQSSSNQVDHSLKLVLQTNVVLPPGMTTTLTFSRPRRVISVGCITIKPAPDLLNYPQIQIDRQAWITDSGNIECFARNISSSYLTLESGYFCAETDILNKFEESYFPSDKLKDFNVHFERLKDSIPTEAHNALLNYKDRIESGNVSIILEPIELEMKNDNPVFTKQYRYSAHKN